MRTTSPILVTRFQSESEVDRREIRSGAVDRDLRLPIVAYAITPWDTVWRPRHEYVRSLSARGWPSLYTNGPLSLWERHSPEWEQAPLFGSMAHDGGLIIDRSGRFPLRWPGRGFDDMVLRWHAGRVRKALRRGADDDLIAISFYPSYWPHARTLRPRFLVYFQYDAHSKMPGWSEMDARCERALVRNADLIVSASGGMADTLPDDGPARAQILPNAVRFEDFSRARDLPCPADLARIPRPRIGHIGSISQRIDFDLLLQVAQAKPEWHFVFIGSVQREGGTGPIREPGANRKWQTLQALPNVHYLPPKPHADIPGYMGHIDVSAMWYRTDGDGWWRHVSPIKVYESLAAGIPVVSSDVAALREHRAVIAVAATAGEWIAALEHALIRGGVGTPEARRQVALGNTWDARVSRLEALLSEMIIRQGDRAARKRATGDPVAGDEIAARDRVPDVVPER